MCSPSRLFLAEVSADGLDARIASGGNRQNITMDRYDANWSMVEKGWRTHVLGEGPQFATAVAAVGAYANNTRHHRSGFAAPCHRCRRQAGRITIEDGDSVISSLPRDRAEITRAFEEATFGQVLTACGCRA